jgi:flavodoxin
MKESIMKSLVIFDSTFGNTGKIAETIAKELGTESRAVSVSDCRATELMGIELIVVGSPIIGWRPSEKMGFFLADLDKGKLKGLRAATFDTRVRKFYHGDAAKKIAQALKKAGAEIIAVPQAFYVQGKEGPLLDGEIEKAVEWAKSIKMKE